MLFFVLFWFFFFFLTFHLFLVDRPLSRKKRGLTKWALVTFKASDGEVSPSIMLVEIHRVLMRFLPPSLSQLMISLHFLGKKD